MRLVCVCLLFLNAANIALAEPPAAPREWQNDAELTAVTFIDADRGWAVGDRGTIWHTADGGRRWEQQHSGVTCRLESVQFLDANNGWAAGGWTEPYTHETRGCVLRTRDGGRTWQSVPGLLVPALSGMKMFDARTGWAYGDASALFPAGVFRTDDGGRTWTPLPDGNTTGWIAADFRDARSGAVSSLDGSAATVLPGKLIPSRAAGIGTRYVRRLALTGKTGGWLVGDGGLVLTTNDNGVSWSAPAGALPKVAANLDFRALAAFGNHVWIAGAPGTCVLHSGDGGKTWQTQATEETTPICGLWFFDEYRGWAVGSLGTILHTRDGGQTWRVQRSGGKRVALLGIFSEPDRLPLEIVAGTSGSEGYLSAVEIIGRHNAAAYSAALTLPRRTQAAVLTAGGSAANAAWQFPVGERSINVPAQTVIERWNAACNGDGIARLEEHLVRCIRQWRPEAIVTENVSPRGDDPLAHLTSQITLSAATKAADGTAYPEQILELGLTPWKVKKVLAILPGDERGAVSITPAQWSPRLGKSLADAAQTGSALLTGDILARPRSIGLSLLVDHLPQATGKRDLMSGIVLSPGGDARRVLTDPPAGDLAELSRLAQRRHNVEQLLARIDRGDPSSATWLSQIDSLTQGLSNQHVAELLWQLGQRYQRAGSGQSAAEAMELLVQRYSQEPLADAAAIWLVQYYASSEIAWRNRKESKYAVQLVSATSQREDPAGPNVPTTDEAGAPLEIIDRSQVSSLAGYAHTQAASPEMSPAHRAGRAIAAGKSIERQRPLLFARGEVQFPLFAAARHAMTTGAKPTLPTIRERHWVSAAAAEQWLVDSKGDSPRPVLAVVTALEKPTLDGRLDEPLWEVAKPVTLSGVAVDGEELPAAAVLARDAEFLYVAVTCKKVAGIDYAKDNSTRPHDTDLAARDHVRLCLDVDRDYATWWELAFDHRGFPSASIGGAACGSDPTWNPQWFLAAGGDDEWWTVEAAIPLTELGPQPPEVRDVWAAQLQRFVPKLGVSSFSQPAAVAPRPEGFGLMVFE